MQVIIPKNVGIKNASAVHFRLPDSFFIVIFQMHPGNLATGHRLVHICTNIYNYAI